MLHAEGEISTHEHLNSAAFNLEFCKVNYITLAVLALE
jgi:hypothetical protein